MLSANRITTEPINIFQSRLKGLYKTNYLDKHGGGQQNLVIQSKYEVGIERVGEAEKCADKHLRAVDPIWVRHESSSILIWLGQIFQTLTQQKIFTVSKKNIIKTNIVVAQKFWQLRFICNRNDDTSYTSLEYSSFSIFHRQLFRGGIVRCFFDGLVNQIQDYVECFECLSLESFLLCKSKYSK